MQKTFFALKGTHFFLSANILSAEIINRLLKLYFCGENILYGGVFSQKITVLGAKKAKKCVCH
jgi:hypothetical protein